MKEDIELLPVMEDDIELIMTWRNMPEVSEYMYTDNKITIEMQKKWFTKISEDPTVKYWMISYQGKKLGVANLVKISNVFDSCSWAFYLGDTSVRGAGIGSKVEFNVLSYVFAELNLNKLNCEVFSFNDKVISMHEKFGFRREGYYRQHVLKNGKYLDVVALALLKTEWNQLKNQMRERIYGE